jgi:hypothetical protein
VSAIAVSVRDGMERAGWNCWDLWLAAFGLGGDLNSSAIEHITDDGRDPTRHEYSTLAAALNERLGELGLDHPMKPWSDVGPR